MTRPTMVTGAPPSAANLPRAAELAAAPFDTVAVAAEGRDAPGRARRDADGSVPMTAHVVVIAGGGPTGLMVAGALALGG